VATCAETAIVGYRLSFPTKENKLPFPLANKRKFAVSISHKFRFLVFLNGKKKTFTIDPCANRSLSFICLLTKKQMKVIRLQRDQTDWSIYARGVAGMKQEYLSSEGSKSSRYLLCSTRTTFAKKSVFFRSRQ
jgi:hypothetical protein